MVTSSISCFEDIEGNGSSKCLLCSSKALAFCSNCCYIRDSSWFSWDCEVSNISNIASD
uniref:Uncharacterized protein n=1 Tax=Medicago truncatula TaxID=3880 RepID=I3T8Z0_MEDTR|nr:unknown [Medicago truncatula]